MLLFLEQDILLSLCLLLTWEGILRGEGRWGEQGGGGGEKELQYNPLHFTFIVSFFTQGWVVQSWFKITQG